jgi:hypothetical protein
MASVGDIALAAPVTGDKPDDNSCGVAFFLEEPADRSFLYQPTGAPWEVELVQGSRAVVARCSTPMKYQNLVVVGGETVGQALDLMSLGTGPIPLLDDAAGFVVQSARDGKSIVRYVDSNVMGLSVSGTVNFLGPDGKALPPAPYRSPQWHPAHRYLRAARLTADIYECCRNLYLALECVLNARWPKQPNEREVDWFVRAISALNEIKPLSEGTELRKSASVAHAKGLIYDFVRLNLFHSKHNHRGGTSAPPNAVRIAKEGNLLWQLLVKAMQAIEHPGTPGGVMISRAAFEAMLNATVGPELEVHVSDQPLPKEDAQLQLDLASGPFTRLPQRYLRSHPSEHSAMLTAAKEPGASLDVAAFIASQGNQPYFWSTLSERLTVTCQETFELEVHFRYKPLGIPRTLRRPLIVLWPEAPTFKEG